MLNFLQVGIMVSYSLINTLLKTYFCFEFSFDSIHQSINETNNSCLLVKVTIIVYVTQTSEQSNDYHLNINQVSR